jgi:hypothetical protein
VASNECRATTAEAYTAGGRLIGFSVSERTCGGSARFHFTIPADVAGALRTSM